MGQTIVTVFSFIPNTAEVAFYGMLQGLDDYLNEEKVQQIVRDNLAKIEQGIRDFRF